MRNILPILCPLLLLFSISLPAQTPDNWRDYADRALARLLLKDTVGAVRGFTAMVRGSGDSASAYLHRGLFYAGIKYYDSAASDFAFALQKEPENMDVYIARGTMNLERKEYMLAVKDFSRCIVINNDHPQAYYLRALVAIQMNDFATAEFDVVDALRIDPTNADIYYQAAIVAIKQQQLDTALKRLNTAIRLDPGFAQAMMIRAGVLIDVGKPEEACQDLVESVKSGFKPALEMLRTQCGKQISMKFIDSLQTYVMQEVTVVGERDEYKRAAQEMKVIAQRIRVVSKALANRLSVSQTLGQGLRLVNIWGKYMGEERPLVVGDGALPFTSLQMVESKRTSKANMDDYIALTADRVTLSRNPAAQKIMDTIMQQRNILRGYVQANSYADARALIQEISAEISAIAEILNKDTSEQAKQ